MKKLSILFLVALFLVGCTQKNEDETTDVPTEVVEKVNQGDYDILTPFQMSPVRKGHSEVYREVDVVEIGRRLLDKSKAHFSIKDYKLSEGTLITSSIYQSLLRFKSDSNPNGLNINYPDGVEVEGNKLVKPVFVTDIYELNFHKSNNISKVDGLSVAMVLERSYVTDATTGAMVNLTDDALFEVGRAMGLQLSAYLRTLPNMNDVPIYIALYVQDSTMDKLPGNYLPGHYIGDALSQGNTTTFKRNNEGWLLLSSSDASKLYPELSTQHSLFQDKVQKFLQEENVGVVTKLFIVDNEIQSVSMEISSGFKTFTELVGTGQYISQQLSIFDGLGVPVTVNIMIHQKTRIVITKQPGSAASMTVLQ